MRITVAALLTALVLFSKCFAVKDSSLRSLAALLNSAQAQDLFKRWTGGQNDSTQFLTLLEPWLFSFSEPKPTVWSKPDKQRLDCGNPRYSRVLSGKRAEKPAWIIDFVPFGYDFDKLLVRFKENYDVVDIFVVYEQQFNFLGQRKPLYFQKFMQDSELNTTFAPFMDKVMHLTPHQEDVEAVVKVVVGANERHETMLSDAVYAMPFFFNRDIVRRFINASSHPLKVALDLHMKMGGAALGIQNDGDEIISGAVLQHLKYCSTRPQVNQIYTPCTSYKSNFNWLQHTHDMTCFTSAHGDDSGKRLDAELRHFLWREGPYVWPLGEMIASESLLRRNVSDNACQHHMGLGAAVHLSAIIDPVEVWIKSCSTVENRGQCAESVSPALLAAGKPGEITPQIIYDSTIFPWCNRKFRAAHVDELTGAARASLQSTQPWFLKHNRPSFPFMFPQLNHDLFSKSAIPTWLNECGILTLRRTPRLDRESFLLSGSGRARK